MKDMDASRNHEQSRTAVCDRSIRNRVNCVTSDTGTVTSIARLEAVSRGRFRNNPPEYRYFYMELSRSLGSGSDRKPWPADSPLIKVRSKTMTGAVRPDRSQALAAQLFMRMHYSNIVGVSSCQKSPRCRYCHPVLHLHR